MATLKDLCKDVPETITAAQTKYDRKRVERELMRRKNASYLHRLQGLEQEYNIFYQGQTRRPQKGKYRNRVWAEQCGSTGSYVATVHTQNSYIHVAVKAKKY